MTVDGFGFGTLTGESCLKNVHSHTDRASWDAILVTVVAFGALMWEKCAQSHSFGLGRVGGGDTIAGGGGSANREPGSYIYIYTPPPPHGLPRGAAIPPPILLRLGFWCMIQFRSSEVRAYVYGNRLLFQFFATFHADTRKDDKR